jgi:hypothetical protein
LITYSKNIIVQGALIQGAMIQGALIQRSTLPLPLKLTLIDGWAGMMG